MKYEGKLIIFTAFYKYYCMSPYCRSLYQTIVTLEKLGIKHDYWCGENSFHIELSIADAFTRFTESDATDLLVIDTDESWNPVDVIKLLYYPDPVVAGTYRKKITGQNYIGEYKKENGYVKGKQIAEDKFLIEADRVPAGFLRIKKEVLLKYIEKYPEDYCYLNDKKIYLFFMNEIKNHQFTGMDYCFSDKLKELGYEIWVDPSCDISHWGDIEFKGNYDKYLRGLKAMEEIKDMKK